MDAAVVAFTVHLSRVPYIENTLFKPLKFKLIFSHHEEVLRVVSVCKLSRSTAVRFSRGEFTLFNMMVESLCSCRVVDFDKAMLSSPPSAYKEQHFFFLKHTEAQTEYKRHCPTGSFKSELLC